jgi:LacI family transcriptional regulator
VRLGHRRIGLLSVNLAVSTHRERALAYRRALREAGIDPNPAYEAHAQSSVADGFSATLRLLGQSPAPTALFVTSNRLIVGAVSAINNRGLRCPEDVSVVGFDDYDWQEAFRPRLTTVAQPAYAIGQRAAQLLIARITGEQTGPPEEIVLHSQLVVRESCGIYRQPLPAE